jgi:hypothetical protein
MISADQVTGIIVTRGDCDLEPCFETWPKWMHRMVWDNSQERDLACFGRWAACQAATTGTVFFQDDDTIIPWSTIDAMLSLYDPEANAMLSNMNESWVVDEGDPEFSYHDLGLQAAGCLAPRDLWEPAIIQYLSRYPEDRFFYEWADFVVGILTPHVKCDLPYECRDLVHDDNRLANTPGNRARRKAMMRRARAVRDGNLADWQVWARQLSYPPTATQKRNL